MWIGLIRIIFYVFVGYLVLQIIRFFQNVNRSVKSPPPQSAKSLSGLMVQDNVCKTYLPKDEAIKEIHEGQEYFFCSKECQRKFIETKK
jgi:uncharacterized protein